MPQQFQHRNHRLWKSRRQHQRSFATSGYRDVSGQGSGPQYSAFLRPCLAGCRQCPRRDGGGSPPVDKNEGFPTLLSAASGSRRPDRGRGATALEAPEARPSYRRRIHSPGRANGANPVVGRLGAGNRLPADRGMDGSKRNGPSHGCRQHQRSPVAQPGLRAKCVDDVWIEPEPIRAA